MPPPRATQGPCPELMAFISPALILEPQQVTELPGLPRCLREPSSGMGNCLHPVSVGRNPQLCPSYPSAPHPLSFSFFPSLLISYPFPRLPSLLTSDSQVPLFFLICLSICTIQAPGCPPWDSPAPLPSPGCSILCLCRLLSLHCDALSHQPHCIAVFSAPGSPLPLPSPPVASHSPETRPLIPQRPAG